MTAHPIPGSGWKTPWSEAPWRRAVVYGLGASGTAAAELLLARGVEVLGVDGRRESDLDLGSLAGREGFRVAPEGEEAELPEGADAVVVSPGVPGERPLLRAAREAGLPVIGEVELAFPLLEGTVVAITGSNGKSTTTALTGAMIEASGRTVEVCGNIGRPLAACVDGPPGRVFVVELSSFQLETVDTFRPRAAALLNLAPDHLDRYDDLLDYGEAKRRIFARQGPGDVAVLNADDAWTAALAPHGRKRLFSRRRVVEDGCYLEGGRVLEAVPSAAPRALFAAADVPLAGVHNLENAMAAALLARAVGAEPEAIADGLAGFRGLPHRLERVAEAGGVTWYDDSKGTNPAAVLKSLEGFDDGSVHLILGGRNKGADFADLRQAVARKARRLYLIGEAAGEAAGALQGTVPHEHAVTLRAAVTLAADHAKPGEVVVLSPACASFDQFRNFAHRGRVFQALVRERLGLEDAADGGGEASDG